MKLQYDPLRNLYVGFDTNGNLAAQGYLEVDDEGVVRFVNGLTPEQLAA